MTDWNYKDALSRAMEWRYGPGVRALYDKQVSEAINRRYQEQVAPTEAEVKQGLALTRQIERQIKGDLNSDLPPSVVEMYAEYNQKQQKEDSKFSVPGTGVYLQLNPDDTVSIVGATNVDIDVLVQLCSIIMALDSLLDLSEPDDNPYGVGQNAAVAAYGEMSSRQTVYQKVAAQVKSLRPGYMRGSR